MYPDGTSFELLKKSFMSADHNAVIAGTNDLFWPSYYPHWTIHNHCNVHSANEGDLGHRNMMSLSEDPLDLVASIAQETAIMLTKCRWDEDIVSEDESRRVR